MIDALNVELQVKILLVKHNTWNKILLEYFIIYKKIKYKKVFFLF